MNELRLLAFLAAKCFWIWPLLFVASGVKGNIGSALYAGGAFLVMVLWAIPEMGSGIPQVNWKFLGAAWIIGAAGIIMFNRMMLKAPPEEKAPLFALSLIFEVIGIAIYHIVKTGRLTQSKGLGFALGAVVIYLLMKKE